MFLRQNVPMKTLMKLQRLVKNATWNPWQNQIYSGLSRTFQPSHKNTDGAFSNYFSVPWFQWADNLYILKCPKRSKQYSVVSKTDHAMWSPRGQWPQYQTRWHPGCYLRVHCPDSGLQAVGSGQCWVTPKLQDPTQVMDSTQYSNYR